MVLTNIPRRALGQPILVLRFNVALAAKLRQVVADRGLSAKVSVFNFHAWCAEQLGEAAGIEKTLAHLDAKAATQASRPPPSRAPRARAAVFLAKD